MGNKRTIEQISTDEVQLPDTVTLEETVVQLKDNELDVRVPLFQNLSDKNLRLLCSFIFFKQPEFAVVKEVAITTLREKLSKDIEKSDFSGLNSDISKTYRSKQLRLIAKLIR